jgi:hypothetical protein
MPYTYATIDVYVFSMTETEGLMNGVQLCIWQDLFAITPSLLFVVHIFRYRCYLLLRTSNNKPFSFGRTDESDRSPVFHKHHILPVMLLTMDARISHDSNSIHACIISIKQ